MLSSRRPSRAATSPRGDSKPPRQRLDLDARRAQLLALGLDLFSHRAYDDVSIDEVAQTASISKGLLYHYFPTKRDFYIAVIREAARELVERSLAVDDVPEPERLRTGLDAYLAYVERQGITYAAIFRGGIGSDAEVLAIIEETRSRFLEKLLAEAPVAERPPALRMALRGWIGFVEATSLDWIERHELDRTSLRDLLADLLPEVVRLAMVHGSAESAGAAGPAETPA
ncbi:TetR family transcriptional regulator [Sorangium cellulosum]|uniref:TetR family transcriptional regulator n=1 Tax=Sorangium cellulosum TaxID=56 RepID=A0A2L0F285_SORCE|nr:TetR/AcrR family transcriptional regulator [Sorangium cellulosum]AUX45688.1 TetR family transcriptional regulator [Sorangium cellulosum]